MSFAKTRFTKKLLECLKKCLGPHTKEHEKYTLDLLSIYTNNYINVDKIEYTCEVEKFIVDHYLYKYFDFMYSNMVNVHHIYGIGACDRFKDYPASFFKYICKHIVDSAFVIKYDRPDIFKQMLLSKNREVTSVHIDLMIKNKSYKLLKSINEDFERSDLYVTDRDKCLYKMGSVFRCVTVTSDIIGTLIDNGVRPFQLLFSDLQIKDVNDYNEIADSITEISVCKRLFSEVGAREYIKKWPNYHVMSMFICMGFDINNCVCEFDHMSDIFLSNIRTYDAGVEWYRHKNKPFPNHKDNLLKVTSKSIALTCHIIKKYIPADQVSCCRPIGKISKNAIKSEEDTHALIELIEMFSPLTPPHIERMLDMRIPVVSEYLYSKYDRLKTHEPRTIVEHEQRLHANIEDENIFKMICPYENISRLNETHVKYYKNDPVITRILTNNTRVKMDSAFQDMTFICDH